ncbi:thioredoxin domain-containing protein [Haloimpatiens sp. FM7330]|uniref:thioredoxin domain-containing protein n=1 Tax=Haloimpatiens sp. FM7330 TaxID=3298610 RepID=UPI00363E9EBC
MDNKPTITFLCVWCHVMERESFEDEEVGKLLNENYVPIKVDREERPDIDSIYMTFCQMFSGSRGWPLTVFMTPDKKPFYVGTYFPKEDRYGSAGLKTILNSISTMWKNDRESIVKKSNHALENMRESIVDINRKLDNKIMEKAYLELEDNFELEYGGFGLIPKFPIPHNLSFLLKYYTNSGDDKALYMVEKTLKSMYKGGLFDHVGYGFCRYSTDETWLVPHFEKMLYDNALLAFVYTETYVVTKNEFYKEVAQKIFEYVIRDMTSKEGGFYCAEDADSEGVEGKFYVWDKKEIEDLLEEEEKEIYCKYYDITSKGNFEGLNIPNLINSNLDEIENNKKLKDKLNNIREKLFDYREKRIHPYKDDKILTSWNGLMIAALSYAGRVFNCDKYIECAKNGVEFILNNLMNDNRRLMARYREGEAAHLGYLDDYSFFIWGLIELYEATFESKYLKLAVNLNEDMINLFWDESNGGFFLYGNDGEKLIVRPKEIYDGAIPSGNSAAVLDMFRLYKITGNIELENKVSKMFDTFGGRINNNPSLYTFFNMVILYNKVGGKEIVICGNKDNEIVKRMIKEVNDRFLPFTTVVLNEEREIQDLIPYIRECPRGKNNVSVYMCENYACGKPITCLAEFISRL